MVVTDPAGNECRAEPLRHRIWPRQDRSLLRAAQRIDGCVERATVRRDGDRVVPRQADAAKGDCDVRSRWAHLHHVGPETVGECPANPEKARVAGREHRNGLAGALGFLYLRYDSGDVACDRHDPGTFSQQRAHLG